MEMAITGTLQVTATNNRRRSASSSRWCSSTVSRQGGAVACLLDGGDQGGRLGAVVDLDGGLFGGVVHRGGDALHPIELLLDPGGAGGAGHALHVQRHDGRVRLQRGHDVTATVNSATWESSPR